MKQLIRGKHLSKRKEKIFIFMLVAIILVVSIFIFKNAKKEPEHLNGEMTGVQKQGDEQMPETSQDALSKESEGTSKEKEMIPLSERMKETWHGDERAVDITAFKLGDSTREGDLVDVRIRYPDGEEFIILSKRGCHQLDKEEGKVTMWLREEEILRLSSSMVDAAVMEGLLYTVRYRREMEQEPSKVTYFPRKEIRELIKNDPNIIGKAETILSEKLRSQLEERDSHWKEQFGATGWMQDTKAVEDTREEKEEVIYVD